MDTALVLRIAYEKNTPLEDNEITRLLSESELVSKLTGDLTDLVYILGRRNLTSEPDSASLLRLIKKSKQQITNGRLIVFTATRDTSASIQGEKHLSGFKHCFRYGCMALLVEMNKLTIGSLYCVSIYEAQYKINVMFDCNKINFMISC